MPGGTNTNFHTSETTNLSGLIYHTSVQDVTPHAPVDSCKDIFWSKWSGVVEWSRPRITYNNICLIRGRKYSTSFHHRICWNFNGIDFCLRGFTDGHPPPAVCFTLSLINTFVTAMYLQPAAGCFCERVPSSFEIYVLGLIARATRSNLVLTGMLVTTLV